jgi:hypothetical protein
MRTPDLRLQDLLILSVIAALGVGTAALCFGLLESEAEVGAGYSVGGALAGALISWSALGALYSQLRRSSGELEGLRDENRVLEQKLIRGSPKPPGYDAEIDERQRLVLARPREWKHRGGTIFDFEAPSEGADGHDIFPARFQASYTPVSELAADGLPESPDEYYVAIADRLANDESTINYSTEYVSVGGSPDGIRAIRFVAEEFHRIIRWRDPTTGRAVSDTQPATREEFLAHVNTSVALAVREVAGDHHPDLQEQQALAAIKSSLVNDFTISLERGTCNPRTSLAHEVGEHLQEQMRTHPEGEEASLAEEAHGTENGDSVSGGGSDGSQPSPEKAAIQLAPQQSAFAVLNEVLPIRRTVVACFHRELSTVFYFHLMDNAGDYLNSSQRFNAILSSVRFLS